MQMATGKTHPRHWRLYIDGIDVSGVMRTVGGAGITFAEEDVTGWSDAVINHKFGHGQASITGLQSVFDNTALGAHAELSAVEEYLTTLMFGIKAAPAAGDPAFAAPLGQSMYSIAGDGPVTVSWELNGPHQDATYPSKVFGNVVVPITTLSATNNSASHDFGAAQASGAHCYLIVTSADAGGTWTLKVQDSADDAAWADYATFTADGQTILSEQQVVTASMDRYVRYQATDGGAGSGFDSALIVVPQ
jgi:hypothetical protein